MLYVEDGWTVAGEIIDKPKEISEWNDVEKKAPQENTKALSTIFAVVDEEQFKLMLTCTSVKSAWEILQTVHEGTNTVRISKLQMLTT